MDIDTLNCDLTRGRAVGGGDQSCALGSLGDMPLEALLPGDSEVEDMQRKAVAAARRSARPARVTECDRPRAHNQGADVLLVVLAGSGATMTARCRCAADPPAVASSVRTPES
jgi:hypothetical protein